MLRNNEFHKNIFISDDLTNQRFRLFKYAKEKCQHTFIKEGKVVCKKDGQYVTINTPDDLFMIGYDDVHPGLRIFTLNVCGIRSKIETPDLIESCKTI